MEARNGDVGQVSNNVITCDFMDEAPGHRVTIVNHEPHAPVPSGERAAWLDGDEQRLGYACSTCGHVADYGDGPRLYHVDPRLDPA
jgi:hypothetical protein